MTGDWFAGGREKKAGEFCLSQVIQRVLDRAEVSAVSEAWSLRGRTERGL